MCFYVAKQLHSGTACCIFIKKKIISIMMCFFLKLLFFRCIKVFGRGKICIQTNDIKNTSVKRIYFLKKCAKIMMHKYVFKKFGFVGFPVQYFCMMYQYNNVLNSLNKKDYC